MKPHSLSKNRLSTKRPPSERLQPAQLEARHGPFAKGTVLPETQVLTCPRVKVADLPEDWLPKKFFEALEHNQKIASCCRHPENHEIEGFKSHSAEKLTDIYIFHCTCGRKHRRFCVGLDDDRPEWKAA